uniref:RabBD domain-containing protein n=1 Tax=Erpetoichthys calabaricus TaxID=27687 RepID=A0A8C4SQW2_ERPCA
MGMKLDLSKLMDEEAKHIWQIIQRDFDMRKKEDDRLGSLCHLQPLPLTLCKVGINTNGLPHHTSHLSMKDCVFPNQPFRFLVNSKCQCRDCGLYTCKACSRYHKKERGWVCDLCRLSR